MMTVEELISALTSLPSELRKLPVIYTDENVGRPWSAEINQVIPWKAPGRRTEITSIALTATKAKGKVVK